MRNIQEMEGLYDTENQTRYGYRKNIQAIRYANKLTQDQVVAKLNLMGISMSKSTYAKLETNRMNNQGFGTCCPC